MAAAEALGVNYRTMMACYDSRRVSRRMRKALEEFRDAGTEAGGAEVDGDGAADEVETLRQKVAELEEEDRGLRRLVETQAGQLEELGRRVAHLVREAQQRGESEPVVGDDQPSAWRPPRRRHGLPDDGVVTLEEQPDEEHAFGPAAVLVAEWRALRTGGDATGSRVDRARARGAPVGVGDSDAPRLPPDIAPGDGAAGRGEKDGPPAVAHGSPGGGPRGTGRSETGAPPATAYSSSACGGSRLRPGPATSEQAIRGLGSFQAHGEVGGQKTCISPFASFLSWAGRCGRR